MVETATSKHNFIAKPELDQIKPEKTTFETIKEKAYHFAEVITEAIDESMHQMAGMPLGFAATVATGTSAPTMNFSKDPKLNEEHLQLSKQIETMSQDVLSKSNSMLQKFAKNPQKSSFEGLHVGEWLHDASESIAKTADKVLHPKEHQGHDVQHRSYLRSGFSKA